MPEQPSARPQPEGRKELRLALVCYGGSSLAIYMHGIAKEIHRLVKASALLEAGVDSDGPSERLYQDFLRSLERERGPRTRVVVDVIAGTSAGGINGIYLAKAIAHNLSQDELRDLWLERVDMSQLVLGPRWLPWKLRLLLLLPRAVRRSPLRGGAMASWLYEALEGMDAEGSEPEDLPSLMPDGGLLELFVTITDFYGYDRQVPITDPPVVHEQRHRHALTFRYGPGGEDDLEAAANGGLAFAARTTSCFPAVFPPVSFEAFGGWVPAADLDELKRRCFRIYELAGWRPENSQFVDGGVLDNKPFLWAIDAIRARPADVEVDRRLLYLEPDPGERHLPEPGEPQRPRPAPTTIRAALGAATGIPRKEPILDDLLDVVAHNERVRRIRDVIETSFAPVADFVEDVLGAPLQQLPRELDVQTLADWSRKLNEKTIAAAGFSYATYLRLKISGVVDRYARTASDVCEYPADSNHAMLVRAVLRAWAEEAGLFVQEISPTQRQIGFLRDFDLGFGERRLRFVTAAFRWWYRDLRKGRPNIPPRADLDRGKQILYGAVEKLRRTMGGDAFDDELRSQIRSCFPEQGIRSFLEAKGVDGEAYVAERREALRDVTERVARFNQEELRGFSANLYARLSDLARDWHLDRRRDLLVRYLGFPLWDVLLYPIQALADAGENDEIEVVRMSPFDAGVLPVTPADKVQGKRLHHFWAFFDRTARENDYLWGRLDGAEHLIRVLLGPDEDEQAVSTWSKRAFEAILEEERGLKRTGSTLERVRALVDALP